jgi:hypothetical protein
LFCVDQATRGGETLVADASVIVQDLARVVPSALSELASRQVRFGSNQSHTCPILKRTGQDLWAVRFRDDGLADFGTPDAYVEAFRSVANRNSVRFTLGVNDAYLLLNGRWLHGRTEFEGSRTVLRVSGDPAPNSIQPLLYGFQWVFPQYLMDLADLPRIA